jgi:tetratricopeptide (TPR) repeat protein
LDRQVIPRWRAFHTAKSSNQLISAKKNNRVIDTDSVLIQKKLDWLENKDIAHAIDYLATTAFNKNIANHNDALIFLNQSDHNNDLIKDFIFSFTNPEEQLQRTLDLYSYENLYLVPSLISNQKKRLNRTPRDPIGWVDLAYFYTILGEKDKAARCMSIALSLSPNNRFVLRSAVRMFIHHDDATRALDVIRKADTLKYDPWLISAEIATARAANKTSKNIKTGMNIVGDKAFSPWHISELAAAIATTELSFGKHKKAKKLFESSLINPTENSVAQVEWAHRQDDKIFLPPDKLSVENTFEAKALHSYQNKDWINAVRFAKQWQIDQPFSSRPAIHGSYIAAVCLKDYKTAKEIASYGLRCNRGNVILLNNLIFADVQLGNLNNAQENINKIVESQLGLSDKQMILATKGLLSFRKGDVLDGREKYKRSIELADKLNNRFTSFLVTYFYLLEEMNITESVSSADIANITRIAELSPEPSVEYLASIIRDTIKLGPSK